MILDALSDTTRAAAVLLRRHDPLEAVLLQAGYEASQRGVLAASSVLSTLQSTGAKLRGATDLRMLHDALLTREAIQLGVDNIFATQLDEQRIVPMLGRYAAGTTWRDLEGSLCVSTVKDVAAAIASAASPAAGKSLRSVLLAAAGASSPGALPSLASLFPNEGPGAEFGGVLGEFLKKASNAQSAAALGDQLAKKAKEWALGAAKYTVGTLNWDSGFFVRGSIYPSKSPTVKPLPVDLQSLSGAAGALQFVLAAVGQDAAAKEVSKAVNTVQSAVQIYQAGQLLLAGASGWGAAAGLLGMASGMGGMSVFGGGASDEAKQRHQEILDLLQELFSYVKQEFRGFNLKLDSILDALGLLSEQMRGVKLELVAVRAQLASLESQALGIAWLINRSAFAISQQLDDVALGQCESDVLNRFPVADKNELGNCNLSAARLVERAARYPALATLALAGDESPEAVERSAAIHIEQAFGASADSEPPWACIDILGQLLSLSAGFALPAPRYYPPAIYRAIDLLHGLHRDSPATFAELDRVELGKQIKDIDATLSAHASLMSQLRGPLTSGADADLPTDVVRMSAPALTAVLEAIAKAHETYQEAQGVVIDNLIAELVGNLSKGPSAATTDASMRLKNWSYIDFVPLAHGEVSSGMAIGTGPDNKPGPLVTALPHEFRVHLPMFGPVLYLSPLMLRIVDWTVSSRKVPGWGEAKVMHDSSWSFEGVCHGAVLVSFKLELSIPVDVGSWQGQLVREGNANPSLHVFSSPEIRDAALEQLVKLVSAPAVVKACRENIVSLFKQFPSSLNGYVAFVLANNSSDLPGKKALLKAASRLDSLRASLLGVVGLGFPASFEALDPLRTRLDGPLHLRLGGADALANWAAAYLRLESAPYIPTFISCPDDLLAAEVVGDGGQVMGLMDFERVVSLNVGDVLEWGTELLNSETGSPAPYRLERARRILDQLKRDLALH